MAYPKIGNVLPMSAAIASDYVRQMIHRESRGPGDCENAMQRLEARYGIGFWQLDHLRKNKAKTCEVGLYARIKAAFADHCGRQAARLLEEAKTAQAVDSREDVAAIQREIEALVARLAAAKGKTERAVR